MAAALCVGHISQRHLGPDASRVFSQPRKLVRAREPRDLRIGIPPTPYEVDLL